MLIKPVNMCINSKQSSRRSWDTRKKCVINANYLKVAVLLDQIADQFHASVDIKLLTEVVTTITNN